MKYTVDPGKLRELVCAKSTRITELIRLGYTVTIRPTKDGMKMTMHKEKEI